MISVNVDLPADNTDVFAGGPLENIPEPGVLLMWFASSQRDGLMTVAGPAIASDAPARVPPILRANGIPDVSADVPFAIAVKPGRLQAAYDEVTAGDAWVTAQFHPA